MRITEVDRPLAITMWDYSWLERRYPGGGYEDWDRALDGLVERGYDAIRIDAYPHFHAHDPDREWDLPGSHPAFPWGSPAACTVRVHPSLVEFLEKCSERGLVVGLTSWYQAAHEYPQVRVDTAEEVGELWIDTLDRIENAGLLDTVCFVEMCNEYQNDCTFHGILNAEDAGGRHTEEGTRRLADSIETVRDSYPTLDYTASQSGDMASWAEQDVSALDCLALHLWMHQSSGFVSDRLGHPRPWEFEYLTALAEHGADYYYEDETHWRACLRDRVELAVEWSERVDKPVVTDECWAVPRAMDWPGLDWGWLKELDEYGVELATDSGRWAAIATSNHCGPQFAGMWDDVEWHRRQTETIHDGSLRT